MPVEPGPHDLAETPVIMAPAGDAHPRTRSPTFFEDLDEFGDFRGHIMVMRFEFDEDWPTWEMHPEGDELVYLLSGSTDMVLRDGSGERTVAGFRYRSNGAGASGSMTTWVQLHAQLRR